MRGPGLLARDAVCVEPPEQVSLAENEPSAVVALAAARECGCVHIASDISVAPRATSFDFRQRGNCITRVHVMCSWSSDQRLVGKPEFLRDKRRATNLLSGNSPFARIYRCA